MLISRRLIPAFGLTAAFALTPDALADHVFVLRQQGESVAIQKEPAPEGKTVTFPCSRETGIIDVILPVGSGGSGSMARFSDAAVVSVTNQEGVLTVSTRTGQGKTWDRPPRPLAELREQDIRVSVTGYNGAQRAFLISRYESVRDEPVGPVIDMFAGRVPMQSGDYVVCTDTYTPLRSPRVYGQAELRHDRHIFVRGRLPDGTEGDFVLDIGAGQSAVAREFLPDGIPIEQSGMVQYSAAGREVLKYEPGGATGKTTSVLGIAVMPEFRAGTLVFKNASMAVLPDLSTLFKRPVAGILGLDLLRHAEVISLEYGHDGVGKLVLSAEPSQTAKKSVATPMATFRSHLGIRCEVNGISTAFILDSGAPTVFLDDTAARAAHVRIDEESGRDVHGVDRGSARARQGTIAKLQCGGEMFHDLPAFVSPLPVFAPLRAHDQAVGLLGNDLFSRLSFLELDLAQNQARFGLK